MTVSMKIFLSGLIAGLISFGTALAALLTDLPSGATLADVSGPAFIVAVVGGTLAALKDWQAYMAQSPKEDK